jgi:Transglycosylase SLT domain
LFNDKNIFTSGDVCYRYYNSKWQWAVGCDNNVIWHDTGTFDKDVASGKANNEEDKVKEVIYALQNENMNYFGGLKVLIDKTISQTGVISDESFGITSMDKNGIFKVKFSDADLEAMKTLYFKHTIQGWFWEIDKDFIGGGVWQSVSNIAPGFNEEQKTLVIMLKGKGLSEGAAILFDYSSDDIKAYFSGTVTTTASLEDTFAKRDVNKLTTLMNSLSNTVSVSDFKCYCGNNCADYAKWIAEASQAEYISGKQNIPDELLLLAIMIQESSCQSVESFGGDLGLMQINPINCGTNGLSSDATTCKSTLLNDNEQNINVGAQILRGSYSSSVKLFSCGLIFQSYSGWEAALRGYNGWGCTGNNNYVEEVKTKYLELVNLYNEIAGTTITCTAGQTKCDGTTYYTCLNNAWISQGKVDTKCGYTSPTGVCNAPQPYSEVASMTDARQRALFAVSALDGTPALVGSVIKDYDLSGGINCFDSTLYVYNKAGVSFHCVYSDKLGKTYISDGTNVLMGSTKNSAGNVIFSINPDTSKCDLVGLSQEDKLNNLKPGDMISIIYNPTAGHDIIFIKWIDENSHTQAQIFDWINRDANGNKVFGYRTIDLSDGKYSVYMYWEPVIL